MKILPHTRLTETPNSPYLLFNSHGHYHLCPEKNKFTLAAKIQTNNIHRILAISFRAKNKTHMKFSITTLLLFCWSFTATAQTLTGKITNPENEAIVGAYILQSPGSAHTHSNELGQFILKNVKVGDTLLVMHLGYETEKIVLRNWSEELQIQLTPASFNLDEVVVGQNARQVNIVAAFDIQATPVNSAQEILRLVPGLFIGQHAGGGKAEQLFLRGFDIDHGTDVQLSVDGMPVNMVSHAHGQGYADLHFIIPETIERIDFGKGPYFADKGNFNTAGYVAFQTKDRLGESQFSVEAGRFNTSRIMGMLTLLDKEKHNIYVASEYLLTDGPFESSQNFNRSNLMAKYSGELPNGSRLSILTSHFDSKWDASGQIPQRLVDDGTISRFGAVDDTEGGQTGRTNIAAQFTQPLDDRTYIKSNLYYSLYDFELYSNFTFFLNDPVNGDQIRQKEKRHLYGMESSWNKTLFNKHGSTLLQLGVGFRADQVNDNELSSTANRKTTLLHQQLGDVDETNMYAFAHAEFDVHRWLFQPGLRVDYFKFNYLSQLDSLYNNRSTTKAIASPKFNIIYNLNQTVQLFLKTGIGFHSNDARVILEEDGQSILPRAYGADLGVNWKPVRKLLANAALWYLDSEQEFVYVGDAGIVEPSGRSRRLGVDLGLRLQISKWIYTHADFNYAFARAVDEPDGADLIPLAPVMTGTGAISFQKNATQIHLQGRYMGDRPANEDDSIVAKGYFITDVNVSYRYKQLTFGVVIQNLFNQEWKETQFATESRLREEVEPVEEIHFTPGAPFFVKGVLSYSF
jgi:outer membrane cobalamin receptor